MVYALLIPMIVILKWFTIISLRFNSFSILEFIFFNEGCQAESICKEFYISSSSLYRIISQINKVIKRQFQFEISLTPVQIIGNERDIRYFLHNIFQKILFPRMAI